MAGKDMGLSGSSKGQRRPWTRWYILAIAGAFIIIAIGLGVGLGVGLTHRGGHEDLKRDSGNSTSSGSGSGGYDPNNLPSGPNRTSTWQPSVSATWQIVLQSAIKLDSNTKTPDPDVSIFDLDLFDNNATIFKTLQNDGKKVICYFSAGSYENFRPDKGRFNESDLGKELDGWPGERWLNLRSANVRSIMSDRIKLAWSKGCDAIDPDNVDGYVSRLLYFHQVKGIEADV